MSDDARIPDTVVGSRVTSAMYNELVALARGNERSISGEIRLALRDHLARHRLGFTTGNSVATEQDW